VSFMLHGVQNRLTSFYAANGLALLVGEGWHGVGRGAGLGGFGKAKVGGVCWQ
jgi:hypothetical protein